MVFRQAIATIGLICFLVPGMCTTALAGNETVINMVGVSPGNRSLLVSAGYTGDDNHNNTLGIEWGLNGVDFSLGAEILPHAASPYGYTINNLDACRTYQLRVTFLDAENDPPPVQTLIDLTPNNPILHNSISTNSDKWAGSGGWGVKDSRYGEFTCNTCHTRNSGNIKRVRGGLTAPNGADQFPVQTGAQTIVFSSAVQGSSDFGNDENGHTISLRICEGCHSLTSYHRYDTTGQTSLDHYNRSDCINCHRHSNGFGHASGAGCNDCHGLDGGPGTAVSHSTHTENDADDLRGPHIACDACHDTDNFPWFKSGTDSNGDGKYSLSETDVCDSCHSPGGTYDGVNDPAAGAKVNWVAGIYDGNDLKAGKTNWCATCHDESPAVISGINAPNVVGDESGAYTYGTGWGYYKTGHGLPTASTYAASGGLTYGAGKECASCHDFSTAHVDSNARTYSSGNNNYQAGYRLKSVNGQKPMNIPRPGQTVMAADEYKLCLSCHDANKYLAQSPSPITTSFRDDNGDLPSSGDTAPISAHNHHLDNMSADRYDSDWDGAGDSQISCVTCHNVHGSTQLSMVNDGKLVGREPGMKIYYSKAGDTVNPPSATNRTLAESNGTVWDQASSNNICGTCHGGLYIKYFRTPPAAPQAPVLSWTGESGYTTDGVEPDSGQGGSYYSFRVNYTDANDQTPRSIQVWVDENDNGVYEASEKHDMQEADAADVNCADGKLYRKTIPVAFAGDGTLDYRFYASDGAFDATGAPTGNRTLTAANNAPELSWTGEAGYEADGANPDSGAGGGSFTFRTNYADPENTAPSSIQVWIDENDNGTYDPGEKYTMTAVNGGDTTYADGKLYTLTRAVPFAGDGSLNCRFYASDGSFAATGTPTADRTVTVTASNSAPILSWTGETNYLRDGVNPDSNTSGSSYTFRVSYADAQNNAPSVIQLWVDENDNGTYEAGEKYDAAAVDADDSDYSNGKLYTKTLPIAAAGDGIINYRFQASDGSLDATGSPATDSFLTVLVNAITVSCSGGKDHTTIQTAVNAASSGDTILVSDCTYNEKVIVDGKNITLKSVNGAASTIIDGGGAGGAVVTFQNSANSTLNGFTVQNGAGAFTGGGIYVTGSSPTIINSTITNNTASQYGGGVYVAASASTITIADSTVSGNITGMNGGIYLGSGASAVISGSTFSSNTGWNGGGIYMPAGADASLSISDSTFSGNRATANHGGAIYVAGSAGTVTVTISGSTFTNNDSYQYAGAVSLVDSGATFTANISNSTFTGNNATTLDGGTLFLSAVDSVTISGSSITNSTARNGGAVFGSANLTITDSTISGNTITGNNGGGLYLAGGTNNVERTTISGNQSAQGGAGVYASGGSSTFTNCMVSGNKTNSLDGGGFLFNGATVVGNLVNCTVAGNYATRYAGAIEQVNGATVTVRNSILWNNRGLGYYPEIYGSIAASYSDIYQPGYSGSGNISTDPLFIDPLDPDSAPTTGGNYHLLIDSPAMDAGTATGAPANDIDGNVRPIGAGIDVGAAEIITVVNHAPILSWTGEPGYTADGVNPDSGAGGASFEFRVNYSDSDNHAPNSIQVWVDTDNNGSYAPGEKYAMSEVDAGDAVYTDGKLYTKTLNLNYAGNSALKYRFYAADGYSQATGQPASDNTVVVNNAPTLSWLGSGNYVSDGVDPESGLAGSNFEFRIRYTDQDNNPPASIQVWVDRNDDGDYLDPGEKITLTPLVPGDTNYADGKDYTATVSLSKAGDNTLRYRFFASDGTPATGDPTTTEQNVTVTNNAPTLAWTGETNYVSNGVDPDAAVFGNNFTFRVKYADVDNEAPTAYQVWIDENNNGIYEAGEKFDMALAGDAAPANDGNQVNGEIYTGTRTLNTPGAIKYTFVFNDGLATATGAPASDTTVTVAAGANNAPILSWATAGCLTEGVRPRTGVKDADFEFRVTYSDADNQCPPTPVQVTVSGTAYDLTGNDGASCQTGRTYYRTIPVATAGDLNYSFSAADGLDSATGTPTTNHTVSVIDTTYKVRPTGGSGWYSDLATAYNATPASGTLLVYPNADFTAATYTGGLSNINKTNRTMQAVCGADLTIISGGANVISLQGNDGAVIDGFSITGGTTYGIYSNADSLTVKNSRIYSNPIGIYLINICNPVSVQNTSIFNNTSNGISSPNISSLVSIADSAIYNNGGGATNGAGVYLNGGGTHSIVRSTFTGNTTTGSGGAIYGNNCVINIDDSTINNNTAGSGGAIFFLNTSLNATVTDTFIQGNQATTGNGGGIYMGSGALSLTNVMLTGNKSATTGGAIQVNGGTTTCLFCTISGNYATTKGGGIYHNPATITAVKNSIVYNNDAGAPTDANYKQIESNFQYSNVDVYNTLINQVPGSGTGFQRLSYENLGGNLTASNPNFVSPLNPASAPTTAGDYHLQSGSPAVNAGNSSDTSDHDIFDGTSGSRPKGGAYDMGAHEKE